ncbi:MAG: hypothetical protein GX308_08735 [Epulopiscium sp.]|nr:hypothetical protein [Candidatus Epulonipiscium sp.]
MEKLITPLGVVAIYNNANKIKYKIVKLDCNSNIFPDIDGRYKIIVEYENDMFPQLIYCTLEGIDFSSIESYDESGEGLECKAFYQDDIKLSIGIAADTIYVDGKRISSYDYDSVNLHNGLGYHILPTTKSQKLIFGVAWIKGRNEANEVQTWYAADPTIM